MNNRNDLGQNNVRGKELTLKKKFLLWLGAFAALLPGGGVTNSIPKNQSSVVQTSVVSNPTLNNQNQGELNTEVIQAMIDGNVYPVCVNTQKLTVETNEIERIIQGQTTIETLTSKKVEYGPAEKAADSDKTALAAIILGATSFLDLGTKLLEYLKAKKEAKEPSTKSTIHVNLELKNAVLPPSNNIFIITNESDPSKLITELKNIFAAGQPKFTEVDYKPAKQEEPPKSQPTQ